MTSKPAVDASNQVAPPLDFSFRCLTQMSDVLEEDPRIGSRPLKTTDEGKVISSAFKLNNNRIQDLNGFADVVSNILDKPEELSWIDLSFNDISKIDSILVNHSHLKMLYLHGNNINDLEEVDKLADLPNLISLSLHGNPLENEKEYRSYVLSKMPNLRTLDFSGVTKSDRDTAATWNKMYGGKRRKGKKKKQQKQ
ncbi:leucine-rich repeat-containing protein 51-like [Saccoglossus kowalevskii]|uniref:Leucine-rich repeat-containing protein 51 n=1 Tax=Saccoglossus kowalevskii TaxID=10224 RepID=A0ABM0GZC0_SACKO|nr:PREDICTED: leucine-rich repeat-containing protein 51-like isoform X1 [Saccoglossus kowalevskii]XP_006824034.1 PREDICTED: leucine-rich repeat-containing protein 51-like isoform X2 [Saccoglossus kowalevskii]